MTASGASASRIPPGAMRHVLSHLLLPLLMCVGMGLAYLGAFHHPQPHGLRVDVVGRGHTTQVLAQTLESRAGDALDVRTTTTRAQAIDLLRDREISGAYLPATANGTPELLVAKAASDTTASAVESVFTKVAARQGAPLTVTDVTDLAEGDPTGQGLFFLLVALSIGSYASVVVVGGAGAVLPLWTRAVLGLATGLIISVIGAVLAGPLFHLVEHGLGGVWAMAWLYSTGILWIGTGVHTFLKRWTTLAMTALFVMLNFTSSGGIFEPAFQPGFFGALHAFWNGAGFVEGARGLVYLDGLGVGRGVLTLVLWALVGLALLGVTHLVEERRRRSSAEAAETATRVAAAAVSAAAEHRPRHAARGPRHQKADSSGEGKEEAVGV